MKKKTIANLIMVAVIVLIAAAGVLGVGDIRGWFDADDGEAAMLTAVTGTVNMERSGVIYPVEDDTVLRADDRITLNAGAAATIQCGDTTVTLGSSAELTVTDPSAENRIFSVDSGEVFVNGVTPVTLTFQYGEVTVTDATVALSVRDGAQTLSVLRGTAAEIGEGYALEYLADSTTKTVLSLENLDDFLLDQIRFASETVTLCFTVADLDALAEKRQQALQDVINGADHTEHVHSYTAHLTAATCVEAGYVEYVCDCGDRYTDTEIPATGHSWSEGNEGIRICISCGETETVTVTETVPAQTTPLETTPAETASAETTPVEATPGETAPVETVPGETAPVETAPAQTTPVETTPAETAPAETKPGTTTHTHSYTKKVTAPTCTTGGYTLYTCSCGDAYIGDATAATGHSWSDWVTDGDTQTRTCSACGETQTQAVPVSWDGYVYITIRCDTILDNMGNLASGKEEFVPSDGVILPVVSIGFNEGETVFEVLNRACSAAGLQIEYSWTPLYGSYYIEGINHLYEFDCGIESGWMYKVNEWFPNYGCSSYYVEDGDIIVWCYTCNGLGEDVGCYWMGDEE